MKYDLAKLMKDNLDEINKIKKVASPVDFFTQDELDMFGLTEYKTNVIEDLKDDDKRQVLSIVDPTGALSAPDVPPAIEKFEQEPTVWNGIMMVLAILAVVPAAGIAFRFASKALKALSKLKGLVTSGQWWGKSKMLTQIKNAEDVIHKMGKTIDTSNFDDFAKKYPDALIKKDVPHGFPGEFGSGPGSGNVIGRNSPANSSTIGQEVGRLLQISKVLPENTVKIFDIGGSSGAKVGWYAMEMIHGKSIAKIIREMRAKHAKNIKAPPDGRDMDASINYADALKLIKIPKDASGDIALIKRLMSQINFIKNKLKSSNIAHGGITGDNLIWDGRVVKIIDAAGSAKDTVKTDMAYFDLITKSLDYLVTS